MTTDRKINDDTFPEGLSEIELLLRRREGLIVRRYHTCRVIREQNVGEHTAGMLQIVFFLQKVPSVELLWAVLNHDIPESITGDVPATVKRLSPSLREEMNLVEERVAEFLGIAEPLFPEEERILKAADYLELCARCMEERKLGNSNLDKVFVNGFLFVKENCHGDGPWEIRARNLLTFLAMEFCNSGGNLAGNSIED